MQVLGPQGERRFAVALLAESASEKIRSTKGIQMQTTTALTILRGDSVHHASHIVANELTLVGLC